MSEKNATLENLASLIADVCGTTCVAVWACAFEALELRCATGISQRHINTAQGAWHACRHELAAGRPTKYRDLTFVPVRSTHGDLIGVVALPVPIPDSRVAASFLDEMLELVSRHLELPQPLPEPEVLTVPLAKLAEPLGIEGLVRHAYARLMGHFGWNVSLVAALLGIPRQTLSARLKSAGAERPEVSSKARFANRRAPTADEMAAAARNLIWPQPTIANRRR